MPAQVLTPAVPSLCAPQSQIPDLSLHRDGVGVAGRASSKQSATSSSKHPPHRVFISHPRRGGWPQDCSPRTFSSPQARFTVQSNQLHPEGEQMPPNEILGSPTWHAVQAEMGTRLIMLNYI